MRMTITLTLSVGNVKDEIVRQQDMIGSNELVCGTSFSNLLIFRIITFPLRSSIYILKLNSNYFN